MKSVGSNFDGLISMLLSIWKSKIKAIAKLKDFLEKVNRKTLNKKIKQLKNIRKIIYEVASRENY